MRGYQGPGEVERPLSIAMIGLRGIPASDGGVERAVEALSTRLAARGHNVTVYGRAGYAGGDGTFNGVRQKMTPAISTKHLEAASHTPVALISTSACPGPGVGTGTSRTTRGAPKRSTTAAFIVF